MSDLINKKVFALAFFAALLVSLFSAISYAGTGSASDVSIDRVKVNGKTLAESKTNFIEDSDELDILVSLTAVKDVSSIHVEAILTDSSSGRTVADSTGTFSLSANQNTLVALNLQLIDSLKREKDFRLEIKVIDIRDNSEKKSFGIKFTGRKRGVEKLDASIDRVSVNGKVVADSKTNFIDESNDFDVLAEFTALEDIEDAHIEAVLRDLRSGSVVADATSNFDLEDDNSTSRLLRLELLDNLKDSSSFELAVKIVDAEGSSIQKSYGLRMRDGNGAAGRALDISIDSIEVEGKTAAENETNFIIIGEGKKDIDVNARLTALEDIENAHVDAILAFENGDVVADATLTFDIDKNENAVKRLKLPLISRFEQNSFRLKVRVVDAEGDSEEKSYGLKISQQRFPFVISTVSLSPQDNIQAGKNLVARLTFKNSGVVPLEGVNAKVSIPELGISSARFIDQIKNSKQSEVREDFILKILDNAPTGTYTLKSEISSQFNGESEVKELPIFILGKGEQPKHPVNDKLVISVPLMSQNIYNDGREATYPLVLANEGPDANAYTVLLDGANWADLRLEGSNVFVIKPKESKTVNIHASTESDVKGEHIFLVTIKSNDKILKHIPLKGNVVAAKGTLAAKLKTALEIILVSFVVLLAAIGFFFGIKRYLHGNSREGISKEPDQEQDEAYY